MNSDKKTFLTIKLRKVGIDAADRNQVASQSIFKHIEIWKYLK